MQLSSQAVRAQEDKPFLERFIAANEPYILRTASQCAGHTVTRSDDEYSVALMAFYEAVRGYAAESGPFSAYAKLVIGRRLTDYYRGAHRFDAEVPLAPQTFSGDIDSEQADASLQLAVAEKMAADEAPSAAAEIEAADKLFAGYGFCFYDLASCSPRSVKTRRLCAQAVAALLHNRLLFQELCRTRGLPVAAVCRSAGLPRSAVERHRRYIIAAALLLDGEYPMLSEYLHTIREEVARCGR